MGKRGNPYPWRVINDRPLIPIHRDVTVRLNGSLQISEPSLIWRSQSIQMQGLTKADGFVVVTIREDSAPGGAFALIGAMVQHGGGGGAPGPIQTISFNIPGFPGKAYLGPGTYAFDLLQAGSARSDVGLANIVQFQLWALGRPFGRTLNCTLDGAITAGWTY